MKKGYTDISILLDRSGSMETIKSDMEGGFKAFIEEQKKLPGELKVTLYQFDNEFDVVYTGKDITEVPELDLVPRGTTALLDSAFQAITKTGERLRSKLEQDKPDNVLFVIITDGMENASREVSVDKLKSLIEQQTNDYKWTFVYLGANQDAFSVASQYGISHMNTISFSSTGQSVAASYDAFTSAVTRSRSTDGSKDFFEEDEQDKRDESDK